MIRLFTVSLINSIWFGGSPSDAELDIAAPTPDGGPMLLGPLPTEWPVFDSDADCESQSLPPDERWIKSSIH
jgi:hypothetical protein